MEGYCLTRDAYRQIELDYPTFRTYLEVVARVRLKGSDHRRNSHAGKEQQLQELLGDGFFASLALWSYRRQHKIAPQRARAH